MIEHIIGSKYILIEDEKDCAILQNFIKKNPITWVEYDKKKNQIPSNEAYLIEKYLSREIELKDHVLFNNGFISIIIENLEDIRKTYLKYTKPESYNYDYKIILNDLFFLVVVQYSYNNNHYGYMYHHGKEKQFLLQNGTEMFEKMNNYVSNNYLTCDLEVKKNITYSKLGICGEIDFMERYPHTENIIEIKCTNGIEIKHYLQLLIYNFCYCYEIKDLKNIFRNKFKILNLLTGTEHYLIISISPNNMFNLLNILAKQGNLSFNELVLVYDLETNGCIETVFQKDNDKRITVGKNIFSNNSRNYRDSNKRL